MATKQRNTTVELARFLFSLLVIGYHIQMTFSVGTQFFEQGALAVEFFFLISGFFFAKSIDKINSQGIGFIKGSYSIMKGKIKGIFPTHIVAIIAVIIVILSCNLANAGKIIVDGIPSIFLVHLAECWDGSFNKALIVPEWYLSAMLVCLLFMTPIALLLRKKLNGVWIPLILIGVLGVIIIIAGLSTNWNIFAANNFLYDLRAWGEMCVGMFAYHLANVLAKKEHNEKSKIALPILEIFLYLAPIIMGFVPIPESGMGACMGVTVVCVFFAMSLTFGNKGLKIEKENVNKVFAFLGSISLAMYLFHPVIITLFEYVWPNVKLWAAHLIIFPATIILAVIYNVIAKTCKAAIKKAKENKQTLEETKNPS